MAVLEISRFVSIGGVLIQLNDVTVAPPGGGIGTPQPTPGSYTADPNFSVGNLPAAMQDYHRDALATLARIHTNNALQGFSGGTLQDIASSGDAYHISRALNHQITAAAAWLWHTGDPAIVNVIEDLTGRYINSATDFDPYGNRMYELEKMSNYNGNETTARLEDSNVCGLAGICARILFENDRHFEPALEFARGLWQRWETDAWGGGGTGGKAHDNPDLDDRHFVHTISNRTRLAWHLWNTTGNANYRTGFDLLAGQRLMWAIGRVSGQAYDSWPFGTMAEGVGLDAMALTYTRYVVGNVYELAREAALVDWAAFTENAYWDGVEHYFLRDAATDGIRGDTTGSIVGALEPAVTITPHNGEADRTFDPAPRGDGFYDFRSDAWYFWPAAHRSAALKAEMLDQRRDGASQYTRNLGGPVSLLVDAARSAAA